MMSRSNKTPAPSRRFVHPSSSAHPSASARKSAPPFSQRPSSSSAFTSARSSRFGTPAAQQDDISASFEGEEEDATPSLPNRRVTRTNDYKYDEIDVHDYSQEEHITTNNEPLRAAINETWQANDFETPVPKRLKRSHSRNTSADPIAISSSPSETDTPDPLTDDDEADLAHSTTIPYAGSRFRPSKAVIKGEDSKTKPSFRTVDPASALPPELATTLPDAFTPSRRKGKRDYESGGLADTVRSWVLQAATEERQRADGREREVLIDEAVLDQSRRGILATDVRGMQWLFVSTQISNGSMLPADSADELASGSSVIVRGNATSWTVPLRAAGQERDLQVATLWESESGA